MTSSLTCSPGEEEEERASASWLVRPPPHRSWAWTLTSDHLAEEGGVSAVCQNLKNKGVLTITLFSMWHVVSMKNSCKTWSLYLS